MLNSEFDFYSCNNICQNSHHSLKYFLTIFYQLTYFSVLHVHFLASYKDINKSSLSNQFDARTDLMLKLRSRHFKWLILPNIKEILSSFPEFLAYRVTSIYFQFEQQKLLLLIERETAIENQQRRKHLLILHYFFIHAGKSIR